MIDPEPRTTNQTSLSAGLLLQGDKLVQLVVLCAEKPTTALLNRVADELPVQLKSISEEHQYNVSTDPVEGAVLVSDDIITVKVSLTSPLLREPQTSGIFISSTTDWIYISISSYHFHITNSSEFELSRKYDF